jgi:adenylate kinase family enzyme
LIMRRVLVVGSSGAGKTTFSRRLSEILDIKLIYLDKEHWRSGWVEPPKQVWRRKVEELVGGDEWIMDGNYSGTLDVRIEACDTVIFLDLPRTLCVWRILKRVATYRGTNRPDLPEGCHEKLDLSFLLWVWNYPSRTRPKVLGLIKEHSQTKRFVHLRSRRAVERFLSEEATRMRKEGVRTV